MQLKTLFLATTALVAACPFGLNADGLALVPCGNQRIWQTVFDASKPLEWRWDESAAKATVTVANLVTGETSDPVTVVRAANALYGSYQVPAPATADSGEALISVSLDQLDASDGSVATATAKLAYLPSSITVDKAGRKFGRMTSARPFAYEAAWADAADATGATYSFTPQDGSATVTDLDATTGWFVQPAEAGAIEIAFTGTSGVLSADVYLKPGFMLLLR